MIIIHGMLEAEESKKTPLRADCSSGIRTHVDGVKVRCLSRLTIPQQSHFTT